MGAFHLFFEDVLSKLVSEDDELFHDGLDDFIWLIIVEIDLFAEIPHHN